MQAALCAIFFASGASALVFETLWFRQMGIALGNSVWASSLVLAGFMAGLALGNALAARFGNRPRHPIFAYALLEVMIGASGFALVVTLPNFAPLLSSFLGPLRDDPYVLNAARLVFAFVLLLAPSTAMGATLPLLVRALVVRESSFGPVLGRLYGWNTLGAVMGPVAAEGLGIEWLGIRGTAAAAAVASLAVATAAVVLSRRAHALPTPPESVAANSAWSGARWLTAAFASGLALLGLEVIWFRFLLLFMPGTSIAFALMLSVVLAGIGLGGLAASAGLRGNANARRWAAPVAFAAGAAAIASYSGFRWTLEPLAPGQMPGLLGTLRIAIPLITPVSFLSGVFFTLAGAALREEMPSAAAAAGRLSFANTAGAASGSLLAGFVLLPALGMERSLLAMALVYGGIGALLLPHAHSIARIAFAGAFALALVLFPFGLMEDHYLRVPVDRWSPGSRLIGMREGLTETLQYTETRALDRPYRHSMLTNSFTMSGTHWRSRRYMKLYVYWPVAVHPDLERALLISYGVGSTAKALTDTPSIETIDVVDISRDVLEMSDLLFPKPTEHPLRDPRIRVHVEDGRHFLQTTTRRFDLITGEPPPPQIAGVVNLYTREYFDLVRSRLAEGGIVTYWLPAHSLSPQSALAVLAAFCGAFPDCSLWHGAGMDLMMVGTRGVRGPASDEAFRAQWDDPRVARELRDLALERPEQLGALFVGDAEYLAELTDGVEPLVDDRPARIRATRTEGGRHSELYGQWLDEGAARERFRNSEWVAALWPSQMLDATLPFFEIEGFVNRFLVYDISKADLLTQAHRLLVRFPVRTPALWCFGTDGDLQRIASSLPPDERSAPEAQFHLGVAALVDGDFAAADEHLERAVLEPSLLSRGLLARIYGLCRSGRRDVATRAAGGRLESGRSMAPEWRVLRQLCGDVARDR